MQHVDAALHDVADQLMHELADRERDHAELVAGLAAQANAIHQLDGVVHRLQTQQAIPQAQADRERRMWEQRLAEAVGQLHNQQRLTRALADQVTAIRLAQQDWQRQFRALDDRTAVAHTDVLAHLQLERHRRHVLEQQLRLHALRAVHRRHVDRGHAVSHAEGPWNHITEKTSTVQVNPWENS